MNRKEKEALRRLRILESKGMLKDVADAYEENKQIFFSEYQLFPVLYYIDGAPKQVLNKIEELTENGNVVYHATHEVFEFGECWDLFVISSEDVEKSSYAKRICEDFDNYGIQFAYVMNMDIPEFSEWGSIQVQPKAGGVERVIG